jgi:perosamine synthetase
MQRMLDDGISTRRGVMNAHLERPFSAMAERQPLPRSERAQQHSIILPLIASMSVEQVEQVYDSLAAAIEAGTRSERA